MNPIIQNTQRNRFELEREGQIAVADYLLKPGVIVVTHIIVPPSLQGQGLASQLAQHILGFARENGLKIEPHCSFMATYMNLHKTTPPAERA